MTNKINKINKIKSLGIFSNYSWDDDLPNFKRYNVIYGWNASGKTTLTKLLSQLGGNIEDDFREVEYSVETETERMTTSDGKTIKIRVFNRDYIEANVQLLESTAKPIYILGEDNKKLIEKIEADETTLETQTQNLDKANTEIETLNKQRDTKFTDIARIISSNASGEATRKYDKRVAESAFYKLKAGSILSEQALEKHQITLKQLEKPLINSISYPKIKIRVEDKSEFKPIGQSVINDYIKSAEALLSRIVVTEVVTRLKDNPDVSDWVESGLKLHKNHKSKTCEYCGQVISEKRLSELHTHFNDEDNKLKSDLSSLIAKLKETIESFNSLSIPDKANLYEELQSKYFEENELLVAKIDSTRKDVNTYIAVLEEKKYKTNETLEYPNKLEVENIITQVDVLNTLIKTHNAKTQNFKDAKVKAQNTLETHYLSTIRMDISDIDKMIKDNTAKIKPLKTLVSTLKGEISNNKSKITSPDKACVELNKNIHMFLGRKDISFVVEGKGYLIKRGENTAKHLSEGEKTAIAFAYFIVHLKDQNFNLREGIVVIDDPVSSLDSNSIFQAFAFLKSYVKSAKQVFILTHNFDFLRLVLNWVNHHANKSNTSLYMIKNKDVSGEREAYLDKLDKDLQDHESEYHYLFKKLYNFDSDGTIDSVYHIPNIARKVLDTFLMFRVPSNENKYKKLKSLKGDFDEIKLTSLNKFTNDNSHITGKGFDPSLVPECTKNVAYLMQLIKATFPEHYRILVDSM